MFQPPQIHKLQLLSYLSGNLNISYCILHLSNEFRLINIKVLFKYMYLQNIVLLMLKKHLVYTLILFLHLEESVSTVSFILFTHSSHSRSHRVSGGGGVLNFLLFFSSLLAPPRSLFIPLERKRQVSAAIALSVCVCAEWSPNCKSGETFLFPTAFPRFSCFSLSTHISVSYCFPTLLTDPTQRLLL